MESTGPVLVRPVDEYSEPNDQSTPENNTLHEQRRLSLSIPEELLHNMSENTSDLREKLEKFINGLNSKISTVPPLFLPARLDRLTGEVDDENEFVGSSSPNRVVEDGCGGTALYGIIEVVD